MKAAITAASGQLGSEIIKEVGKMIGKRNVIAVARNPQKIHDLDVEVRAGDYEKKDELIQAFAGVDVALLVSSNAPPENRPQQHAHVTEAAKIAGAERIVFTSVIGKNRGGSFSPIVDSMLQTEEYIKKSGMDWTVGRNGLYIEPDLDYMDHYISDGKIVNCAGDGKCC